MRKFISNLFIFAILLLAVFAFPNTTTHVTAAPETLVVTSVSVSNSHVKITYNPVPGAKDYRIYDITNPNNVKYAGLIRLTPSPACPGSSCFHHFALQGDGVTPVFPYQVVSGATGGPQVLDVPATEIDYNNLGDNQPHTLIIEAVDQLGPVPPANLYIPVTNVENNPFVSPLPAGSMLGGNKGPTPDGKTSTNGQGPYTNNPTAISQSRPFIVQANPNYRAIPSTGSATQTFFDSFEQSEAPTILQTSRSDNFNDIFGQIGKMDYTMNAGTSKAWEIKYRGANNRDSMPFISSDHFMDVLFDGATPGSGAPTHTVYGTMSMTPTQTIDISGGRILHLTMEFDGHQSLRRWMDFNIAPASDPLQGWVPDTFPINNNGRAIFMEIFDGMRGCFLKAFTGTVSATDKKPVGGNVSGWQCENNGQMYIPKNLTKNGLGFDNKSRYDLFISETRAAFFQDGVLITQSAIPAGSFSFANQPLRVYYTHYLYHSVNDIDELLHFGVNGQFLCYPMNSYLFNNPVNGTSAGSNSCGIAYPPGYGFPHSDERHWDNMGFEVLPASAAPSTNYASLSSLVQLPTYGPVQFSGTTPPPTPPAAPTITSFTASPTSITSGQSSTLSWSVSNATSLSINQGIGTVTGTSRSVNPTATTTYTLTATNTTGSVTATTTVTVGSGTNNPPTVSISAPSSGATVTNPTIITANASDDVGVAGVQFRIDGTNLGSEDTSAPYSISWNTSGVSAGSHTITAVARDTGGLTTTSAGVTVTVQASGGSCPATIPSGSFLGCYYNNTDFTSFALSRTDAYPINFNFGTGSPDAAVGVDTFSARWEGDFTFNTSSYTFTMTGDDGIRLYIDGVLMEDHWIDQAPTTYTHTMSLNAGTHRIRFDFYDNTGGAQAALSWVAGGTTPPPPPPSPMGTWVDVTPSGVALSGGSCDSYGTTSVVADPLRQSDLYAQFNCLGVWKSTNYGQTWTGPINTGANGLASRNCAGDISIAPGTPGTPIIYQACIRGSVGFWRSLDGGVNWATYNVSVSLPGRQDFYSPHVDPYDGNHLLMAGHEFNGLFQSFDGGVTWAVIPMAGGMTQNGGTPFIFFINTGNASTTRNTFLFIAQETSGTWRTSNGGSSWTKVDNNQHPHGGSQIYQPDNNGVVYMAGVLSSLGWGVLRSTDYGQTWTHVGNTGGSATVFGTPNRVFSNYAWACGGCDVDPNMQSAPQPGITGWANITLPAGTFVRGGVRSGPALTATVFDGTNYVIVGANWRAGLWRYVEAAGGTPVPTATISANPTSITSGQSSTLTWSSTNATGCTASGAWSGAQSTSGTRSVNPTSTSTYSLSCTGTGGTSSTVSATVTVTTAVTEHLLYNNSNGTLINGWTDCSSTGNPSSEPLEYTHYDMTGKAGFGTYTLHSGTWLNGYLGLCNNAGFNTSSYSALDLYVLAESTNTGSDVNIVFRTTTGQTVTRPFASFILGGDTRFIPNKWEHVVVPLSSLSLPSSTINRVSFVGTNSNMMIYFMDVIKFVSSASTTPPPPPPPPTPTPTPPTVSLTAPAAGSTVANTVTMTANATDDVGVATVEFIVDGAIRGSDTSSPYSFGWDTTNGGTHPCNGNHTHSLTARATDTAGASSTTTAITVNMGNPSYCSQTNNPPVGNFDEIRLSDGVIRGWTYDPDATSTAIPLHIYIDGQAGAGGTLISGNTTNILRTDVNNTFSITGNHGVEFTIPTQYRNGVQHSIYLYGVDATNPAVATLLPGSPRTFTLTGGSTTPPAITGLHVSGNQILNGQNQVVKLVGVTRSGTEYMCNFGGVFDGPSDQTSIAAMLTWKINIVRIPINEICWINNTPSNYQSSIISFVNLLNQNGIAAIIDLQWVTDGNGQATGLTPMPDANHATTFWTSVANTFENNSSVIFDLFNEPYPDNNTISTAAWTCLRDGGTCPGVPYTAVGMQSLVNTVRATGATNIIMVPGITYTNTLNQWLTYKPTDSLNNLAASWHSYPNQYCSVQSCWDSQIAPVMAQVPLIVGEIGQGDCAHSYIDPLMDWLDARGGHYLAWAWNTYDCSSFPSLITNFNGTPTNFGIGFRDHLLALNPGTTPTVTISANPTSITSGQSSTLTWSSTNATTCTASGAWSGTRPTVGTSTVSPTTTSTYTLTCGTASGSVTVTVGTSTPTPFNGPHNIPGRLEAEDFDNGGEGVGYHDLDTGNNGNSTYRSGSGVDLEITGDTGGGANVAYAVTGEWMRYTINVGTTGTYNIAARVASNGNGGTFHIEIDGTTVGGTQTIPNTNGWQTYTNLTIPNVSLTSGTRVLRLVIDSNGTSGAAGNFNYFDITSATSQAPTISSFTASPTSITSGSSSTLSWSVSNATSLSINQGIGTVTGTSRSVSPTATTTYTLTATNATGSMTANATVTVTAASPTVSLSAFPTSITSGSSSTLTWSSTNATSCTASGAWSGTKSTSSSESVSPTSTSTYTLSCTGAGGTTNASATVTVTPGSTPVVGDINLDHIVNSIDYSILNSRWFTSDAAADLNDDGIVNAIDYSILNQNWFRTW